jgi:hypothetical protein
MEFAWKKGIGMIGILMIMGLTAFFWTMFFIFLNIIYTTVLPGIISDADTLVYFNTILSPIWYPVIPILFLLSMCLWAFIQSQNPMASFVIAIVWITIVAAWFTYSTCYIIFDPWIIKVLPGLLPLDQTWSDAYNNFIPQVWHTMTWMIAITLAFFGCYLAPSYFEQGGKTYDFASGY